MKDTSSHTRQQAILNAAFGAFATYGHRKTSMDDIARAAGMSRPALYLHYRNKKDIFRSLAQFYYDQAGTAVAAALGDSGAVADVLGAAFAAQGGDVFEVMLTSPHGLELLDATNATASDIVQTGEAGLRDIYTKWLDRAAASGQVVLAGPAQDMAGTMMAALKGIKMAGTDYATYKRRVALLAVMIGSGLETR
ncbi:MAG: TetR family transcriptional regulator [Rhodobacteraceae bacterium]|nr:MAG: TetR family transcriptional regulator [Paracoccaceae bacterium]